MASRENMQKHTLDAKETQEKLASTSLGSPTKKKLKMTDLAEEEDNIWEREARKLYVPKDDEGWRPWSVRDRLLLHMGHADIIIKYGAMIFEDPVYDDEDPVDPVDATVTDEEPVDDVVSEVDVVDEHVAATTNEEPAHEDPMEEDGLETAPGEQAMADQVVGVPEDDATAPDDQAASPNAQANTSAASSSDPLPDNP